MHQIIIRVWYERVSLWYEVYVGVSIFLNNPNIIRSYCNSLLVQFLTSSQKGKCVSKPCLCSCILRCKVVATPIQVQSSSNPNPIWNWMYIVFVMSLLLLYSILHTLNRRVRTKDASDLYMYRGNLLYLHKILFLWRK